MLPDRSAGRSSDVRSEADLNAEAEGGAGRDAPVEGGITEEELTALALAADPAEPLDASARPDQTLLARGTLPRSYMPAAMGGHRPPSRTRTLVALALVVAFVVITALGYCITYGALVAA